MLFPTHHTSVAVTRWVFHGIIDAFYEQETIKWLIHHPGRCVTIYQVGALFRNAFSRVATVQKAVNGFKKTGISPFNRDVFSEHLFAPSETTEKSATNSLEPQLASRSENITPQSSTSSFEISPVIESQTCSASTTH